MGGQPPAPWPTGPASGYGAGYGPAAADYVEDRFDLPQAARDWIQVLSSPQQFFAGQVGREGLASPMAFMLAVAVIGGFASGVGLTVKGNPMGMVAGPCAGVCLWVLFIIGAFIWGGITHGVCKIFGGSGSFAGSFRIVSYVLAPMPFAMLLNALLSPAPPSFGRRSASPPAIHAPSPTVSAGAGVALFQTIPGLPGGRQPGSPPSSNQALEELLKQRGDSPLSTLAQILFWIYQMVLMGIGIHHVHRVSTGASVGATIVLALIQIVLIVILVVFVAAVVFAAIMGAAGAAGAGGMPR